MTAREFTIKSVAGGQTLGQKLKQRRRARKITLKDAEEKTSIRLKYLKSLEEDRLGRLTPGTYGLGFAKSYAQFLDLNTSEAVSLYQKQRNIGQRAGKFFSPWRETVKASFSVTPKALVILAGVAIFLSLAGYIVWEVLIFLAPPTLSIFAPANESIVAQDSVEVKGQTQAGAILYINDLPVNIDPGGVFSQNVKLEKGTNTLEIKALSKANRQTSKTLKVIANY